MPSNAINPNNYNIDDFDSGFLGPITDTNFRTYLFSHNLSNVNPIVNADLGGNALQDRGTEYDVSQSNPNIVDVPDLGTVAVTPSVYNNFTDPRQLNLDMNPTSNQLASWYPDYGAIYNQLNNDYASQYGVPQTLRIGFVGNVDSWVTNGYTVTAHEIRDIELLNPLNNRYGPSEIIAYSTTGADDLIYSNTGYIEYSTFSQGDFRDQLLSRSLGVGIVPFSTLGSGIDFKPDGKNISELDTIARKRRGEEVANRIKLNFTNNTIGMLNTSPFDLLAGGNLIQQNYKITVPKTSIGKAAEFAADLAGFTLPTSIIPAGAFGEYGVDTTSIDVTSDIIDYTGSGQKSLLYNALFINKYGPKIKSNPTTSLLGIIKEKLGAGQQPQTQNYLNYSEKKISGNRSTSIIDAINNAVKGVLTKSSGNSPKPPEEDISPSSPGSDKYGGFYGRFEQYSSVGKNTLSENGGFNGDVPIYDDKNKNLTTYNGTPTKQDITVTDERFDWRATTDGSNPFKRGLLKYTQDLVNKSKLGSAAGYIGYFDSVGGDGALVNGAHQTGVKTANEKPNNPSKGNTVRNLKFTSNNGSLTTNMGGGDSYCRSWSSRKKYHTWSDLIRSGGNWWKGGNNNTDMTMNNFGQDNVGIPKIAWENSDSVEFNNLVDFTNGVNSINKGVNSNYKGLLIPYMFSIENLAWKDAPQMTQLPPCEVGPNGGRIMWFPPYDINFTDNTSVSWDSTNFIGRGEPIYTYNHTERSGSLDFTIIVDHPSVLNDIKKTFKDNVLSDEAYHSFFAGCDADTLKEIFANYIPSNLDTTNTTNNSDNNPSIPKIQPKDPAEPPFNNINIFFENCRTSNDTIGREVDLDKYEVTVPSIVNVNENDWNGDGELYPCGPAGDNSYEYLNKGIKDQLNELATFLVTEEGKNYTIKINGYTSPAQPNNNFNVKLSQDRANSTQAYLYDLMDTEEGGDAAHLDGLNSNPQYPLESDSNYTLKRWVVTGIPNESAPNPCTPSSNCININGQNDCCDGNPCDITLEWGQANSSVAKSHRYSEIILEKNLDTQILLRQQIKNDTTKQNTQQSSNNTQNKATLADVISKNFITECDYFESIKKDSPFIYNSFSEKIKNFHPAFHSITPEGFNSRLTFLHQCTRQGPQIIDPTQPSNMVFGRPPICVLRIGDFYHTKIVIDSMNITYEPLQWDLNPEGIGVQPMLAKINMSFKFIGGSSLGGPIKQLQNAVSYNFFANTGVYNPAKILEQKIGDRMKFIYGSFLNPNDEDTAMNALSENLAEIQLKINVQNASSVNSTSKGKEAAASSGTTTQTDTNIPKNDTTGVSGNDNVYSVTPNNSSVVSQVTKPVTNP